MDRRSFFKWFGMGIGAAPAVKAVVQMPDAPVVDTGHGPERFIDGPQTRRNPSRLAGWSELAYLNIWDVQDGLLYDRIRFNAGERLPHRIEFFNTPVGQICPKSGVLKTLRHTNMWLGCQLSAPNQFLAQRALFAVHPSTLQSDIDAVSEAACWEFRLLQKIMWGGPMLLHGPGRGGLRNIVKEFPKDRDHQIATAQNPLPDEVIDTAHHSWLTGGTFIPSLCCFTLTVETPDSLVTLTPASEGGKGLDLLIALQGADARGVQ